MRALEHTLVTYERPSPWLKEQVDTIVTRLTFGAGARCEHLQDGTATMAVAAVWSTTVVCGLCSRRHALVGDADNTCDKCGVLSRPRIWAVIVQPGPGLVVVYGLCESCKQQEVAE